MNPRSSSDTKVANLRTRIREATAAAILDAAEAVFASNGLHGTHMGDIAARAGVAVGTLYNHFKDRDALLAGLVQARGEELLAVIDESLKAPRNLDFATQLTAVLHSLFGFVRQHRPFYTLFSQGELSHTDKFTPDVMRGLHERLDKLMKRGVREKVLRPDLAPFYASLLMGLMRGMGIQRTIYGTDCPQLEPEQLTQFFLRGGGA